MIQQTHTPTPPPHISQQAKRKTLNGLSCLFSEIVSGLAYKASPPPPPLPLSYSFSLRLSLPVSRHHDGAGYRMCVLSVWVEMPSRPLVWLSLRICAYGL